MFDIKEELKKLPLKSGVYIMKNEKDEIIYVGKAVKLKNRVSQYFQNSKNQSPKVLAMVKHIKEFEYIVTDTEMEALILECNLIKEHSPKYNIQLKDDKAYPYIKVTLNEDFPRIFVTRRHVKDGGKYYGPITDATAAKETVETVHKMWQIRKCKKVFPRDLGKERACLNYHIGQCGGPCDNLITKEDYLKIINEAMDFLEGKHHVILESMKKKMYEASENMEYETAAAFRDKVKHIETIIERQKMSNTNLNDSDIIALARAHNQALVQVFFIRGGKMTGREHFLLNNAEDSTRGNVITEFVKQFYSGTALVPKELVLEEDLDLEEREIIENWLCTLRGNKVTITVPQKGEKHKLVELANKNAIITLEQFGDKMKREKERTIGAVEQIQNTLGLEKPIKRIEAFDISHTQGYNSVGSMVVFEDGRNKKSDYRKFKIKTVIGNNDFASMEEVLTRRINHSIKDKLENSNTSFSRLPDLIMMDGGKPQVSAALGVLLSFGLDIPVCGMFKDDHHRTKGLIYNDKEFLMPTNSEGFKLVTRIQDEVHRFAIEYHRSLRDKAQLDSILNHIPNIGPTRRKALLKHFGDIEKIKSAEVAHLLEVPQMNIKAAETVYSFFRSNNND
ncbi:MAG: excinuclease ABC subunit UvrC [Anaerotignaceae bacterium]